MRGLLFAAIAILVAAGVAYVWVVPGALDQIGVETVAETPAPAQPSKDTSRIATPSTAPDNGASSADVPSVGVLDVGSLPFDSGCGAMPAAMIIDGTLVMFERTTADGEPLGFGQYPRQVFDNADNSVRVVVDVDFGDPSEPEDVPVTSGEITVMKAGRPTLNFRVTGGAGC